MRNIIIFSIVELLIGIIGWVLCMIFSSPITTTIMSAIFGVFTGNAICNLIFLGMVKNDNF